MTVHSTLLLAAVALSMTSGSVAAAQAHAYEPNWPSLMSRPLPSWFDEAKIGVFIHWGVFSVPSYGGAGLRPRTPGRHMPSEWYWHSLKGGKNLANPVRGTPARTQPPEPEIVAFHNKTYGPDFTYPEFAPLFTAELWDPDQWAGLFKKAGIKYVVLTSKHHEGFCEWCSAEAWNWNSCTVGPKRDLVGELTESVRSAGLRMGLYLSMFEWFHPLYLQDVANNFTTSRYVDEVYWPQAKEINTKYKPDLLWSDGDEGNSSWWKSAELLAWLYNEAPNKDTVVVNDRWGMDNPLIGDPACGTPGSGEPGCHFGGYFSGSDRQKPTAKMLAHKWESAFTLDGSNWGYARDDNLDMYLNITSVLKQVVSTVAYGGNILVNVGPTADGRIATIFQERLLQMGEWLGVNGEGIYGSKMWRVTNESAAAGVYYTSAKASSDVYAFATVWPPNNVLRLPSPLSTGTTAVSMLGCAKNMSWRPLASGAAGALGIEITLPPLMPTELPSLTGPWTFKLSNVR